MKKLLIISLLFLFTVTCYAQQREWSEKIRFGNRFKNTDSLKLKPPFVDSLYASGAKDTLFSDAIAIDGKDAVGLYGISVYLPSISGTSASINLDVRFGVVFIDKFTNTGTRNSVRWEGGWHNIYTCKKDTLYRKSVSAAGDAWWSPASTYRQYRLREADADTVGHEIADFIR